MGHFKISAFNANSIRVRLDQILDWMAREEADVICVQETKVQDEDFPKDTILDAGYYVQFAGQKSHAGVATVSRTEPDSVSAGFDDGDDAARLLYTVFDGIHVVNAYVPQGREMSHEQFAYKLDWLSRIRSWFDAHFSPDDPIIWLGDFNVATQDIDVYDPKSLQGHVDFNPEVQAALEEVRQWGFTDIFRKHHPDEPNQYTYYDYRARNAIERNVGWRIDHIWATAPLAAKSIDAWIDLDARRAERPSDHTFLVAEFEI
ncbi:MAG: exodeoxyribonuclease III [Anaerolineae bacterium]|nr:exodeoxyribonuclease III [Anaerolineae bacterium]